MTQMLSSMVGPQRHAISGQQMSIESVPQQVLNEDNCIGVGYYMHRNKLGEGGFGKVRLATHLRTGHKVAVKIMDKQKLGSDLCRVRVEINSLKLLKHENIAKLLQVIETQTEIYLVLEYCSGGELFDYLVSKNRLSEMESKTIMRQLVTALAFIHRNGFAHRDLKPENILFDSKHRIKLIDFGLAANGRDNNNSLTHLSTCCGSPAYAAPELLQGPHYSGPAVDVWSAGVLLYALLVGRLPFDDDNIGALYKKIQSGFYKIPDWLSIDAKDLIRLMLKTNPKERITIDQIITHKWLWPMTEGTSNSIQIMVPNIDEEVFFKCHRLFPETPIKELRQNILYGFGYQTASYWLTKMNANSDYKFNENVSNSPNNKFAVQRRRSKSCDETTANESDNRLKLKRKIVAAKGSPTVVPQKRPNLLVVKVIAPAVDSPNSKIPVPLNTLIAHKSPTKRGHKEFQSPINTPIITNKKRRFFSGLNDSIGAKSPLSLGPKSPLQNLNNQILSPKTPMNGKPECTPKKSLLKRFLETATPAKSQTPRAITTSTASKNITLTKFIEPQECIEKLMETLTAKGIQCKQKDFSLRCVLSTNNVIVLSFNLEICKFDNRCVIQRKRLKGNAWDYKKVCEDILRISNE